MIGTTVSKYKIVEKLGQGGMGEVYLADDTTLGRQVALKFLSEQQELDPIRKQRFLREARMVAAINHPFICAIHEIAEVDGRIFLALEYVEGPTLSARLGDGALPRPEALQIASEIAEALERAHNAGVVHRDLKPSNIMLTSEGHAKVMDFGLAKRAEIADVSTADEQTLTAITQGSSVIGTPSYMSPEQLVGDPTDKRTDIFSFGIILYELLTGFHPFRRETIVATTRAIIALPPPPLSDFIDAPDVLQHTVSKMLAKDPENRYQSVHEVSTNLRELINQDLSTTGTLSPAATPAPRRWWPKARRAGALAGLVAAGLALWWLGARTAPPPIARQTGEVAAIAMPRIAVLPFDNLSGRPDEEIFSDGLTESLISRLARVPSWQVISRTSVMQFKGSNAPIPTIARQLGVDYILEGSLTRMEGQCLVRAQLIRTRDDVTIWNDEIELDWTDIFDIQQQVSSSVTAKLKLTVQPEIEERLARRPTQIIEAYNSYLKANHKLRLFESRLDFTHAEEAEELFESALELDPDYVEAMAGLGYLYFSVWDLLSADERWLDKSQEVLDRAVRLDPRNAETNIALTALRAVRNDIYGAIELALRVLEENPNSSRGHRNLANLYFFKLGLFESAIEQYERTIEVDPLVTAPYANAALALAAVGRSREALARLDALERIEPDWALLGFYRGSVLTAAGELETAQEVFSTALADAPEETGPYLEVGLAILSAARGDEAAASRTVARYRDSRLIRNAFFAEYLALLCLMVGDAECALQLRPGKLWSTYRKDVLDIEFVERYSAGARARLAQNKPWLAELARSHERWQDRSRHPELDAAVEPPPLPTPEVLLK